jgi:hypothetical protein
MKYSSTPDEIHELRAGLASEVMVREIRAVAERTDKQPGIPGTQQHLGGYCR